MLLFVAGLVVVVIAGAAIGVRSLDHDVERWHVDPVTAPTPPTPNSFRAGGGSGAPFDREVPAYPVDVVALSSAWDRVIDQQPRVSVVADDRSDAHGPMAGIVTYVQRSALFGFPDYVSVRFVSLERSAESPFSTLVIFSRSRLGQSDLGVNERRVTSWLDQLESELG